VNLQHLKYAVEVERHKSISKAAEALYLNQPYLSKAIRELEGEVGIEIFHRTSRGVIPTPEGEEFLAHAKDILSHVEEVEDLYRIKRQDIYRVEIAVPIACYISQAFVSFVKELTDRPQMKVDYYETSTMTAIERVVEHGSNLGIIRYQDSYEAYFLRYLESKDLAAVPIWQFSYHLIMSKDSPLAARAQVDPADLEPLIEISHGDPTVPTLPVSGLLEMKRREQSKREIVVYERQSQFELLCDLPETYMWASPTPRRVLDAFPLVERECPMPDNQYTDMLIYRKGYRLSREDQLFIEQVHAAVAALQSEGKPEKT
jgi:DNA-binding transcriptional LysR family regulator